ncbi:MAG: replication-associated recombination protein A, partial [Ruminiclostridium sp.]
PALKRAFDIACRDMKLSYTFDDEAFEYIASGCGGDVRKGINTVELCMLSANEGRIDLELAKQLTQKSAMKYDRAGDQHYDILSAFQKSIRGSDENAALHYLARLITAGDMASICRRLLVIACEDIGLAYPAAITIVKACVDSALQLGFPEARIPLAEATILLATSPKSNSAYLAINKAIQDVEAGNTGDFPRHLQNVHCDGEGAGVKGQHYLYPHDYPNHYVEQQYLPDNIKDRVYYEFGDNKMEQAALQYRKTIKNQ